jgi:transposase InsO family protein
LAGCTAHPTGAWVAQQARNLAWHLQDGTLRATILLHDRDSRSTAAFHQVFACEGLTVVHTSPRCPWANGYAERWVGSARRECLDHLLILSERHLQRVLTEYTTFYNGRRPHQGLDQWCPIPPPSDPGDRPVRCRDLLGGILHDYHREAA